MNPAWHSLSRWWCVDHRVCLNKHILTKPMKLVVSWTSSICIFINFFDVNIQCTQTPPRAQIYFVQLWTWHPLTLLSCMVSFCQLLSHSSTILLSLVVALSKIWWVCRHQFCWLQGIVMWVSLHVLICQKGKFFFKVHFVSSWFLSWVWRFLYVFLSQCKCMSCHYSF